MANRDLQMAEISSACRPHDIAQARGTYLEVLREGDGELVSVRRDFLQYVRHARRRQLLHFAHLGPVPLHD